MNFKSIYDPKHVYEGFFETYFIRPFIHHYADFNGKDPHKSCGYSLLAWLIITLGLVGVMLGLVGLLGPEVGFATLEVCGGLWLLLSISPILALFSRKKTHSTENDEKRRTFLPIDIVLSSISILFFFLGILMMISTLNSEELTADPGTMEEDTTSLEFEDIVEEPIFTYQDEVPEAVVTDSLEDLEDPEAIAPEESFDPVINETDSI